jgi:hypothetical protein
MKSFSQETSSPSSIRLSSFTKVGTPQTHHTQLKRTRDGRFNPSPALTPDAKARRRRAIEAAIAQASHENSHLESAATLSQDKFNKSQGIQNPQKIRVDDIPKSLLAKQNSEASYAREVISYVFYLPRTS